MINLPIYRAKKLDSDEYIIGQYIETEFSNEEYCDIEEQETIIKHCIIKDFRTVHDDYEYCNFDITEIDPTTLSIHFPDMLDSQGNKIFTSLSEDGKGGDKIIENGKYEDSFNPIFNPYFRVSSFSIEDLPKTPYGQYELHKYKVIGIQK